MQSSQKKALNLHILPSIKGAGSGTVRPSALDQRVQADLGWLQYGLCMVNIGEYKMILGYSRDIRYTV